MRRRRALLTGALAASLMPAALRARGAAGRTTRPAEPRDVDALVPLLLRTADRHRRTNPALWALPADAVAQVQASLRSAFEPPRGPVRHQWTVIERQGHLLGATHAVLMPAPPLYDPPGGGAGILLDDSALPQDRDAARTLVNAAEAALHAAGAQLTVVACPADWLEAKSLYAAAGYAATTLYMAKSGLSARPLAPQVRKAGDADISAISTLGSEDRAQLAIAHPHFWRPHPEADARFAAWMRTSLHLPDREMFVSDAPEVDGYLIAQTCSPSQLPPPFDPARVGLIDDFHSRDFAMLDEEPRRTHSADGLLDAAEAAFKARGLGSVLNKVARLVSG